MKTNFQRPLLATVLAAAALTASAVAARNYGDWGAPVSVETLPGSGAQVNTVSNDGCPIQAPDGLTMFIASNRPNGLGGQDIWFAQRPDTESGWGDPVNPGAPVNSVVDDFCPTPVPGGRLFFVSRRDDPAGDIYLTRMGREGFETPHRLGANVNSAFEEWSPSYYETGDGHDVLYFSSTRAGGQDIWFSVDFGPAQLASGGVNTPGAADARPNVAKDGLEIVWDSNRAGGIGLQDIWSATRASTDDPWGAAVHLPQLNSAMNETRASLSRDGSMMLFGSNRGGVEGMADIFISRRAKQTGKN